MSVFNPNNPTSAASPYNSPYSNAPHPIQAQQGYGQYTGTHGTLTGGLFSSVENEFLRIHAEQRDSREQLYAMSGEIYELRRVVTWLAGNPGRTVADYDTVQRTTAEFDKALADVPDAADVPK